MQYNHALKNKEKIKKFSNHCFLVAGDYSHFQASTMLLLSYFIGCLIHPDSNVPIIQSIVLILRHFFYFKI